MANLTATLNSSFTPSAGDFLAQATNGVSQLQRANSSTCAWATIEGFIRGALIVSNPVAGAGYRFIAAGTTNVIVSADQ